MILKHVKSIDKPFEEECSVLEDGELKEILDTLKLMLILTNKIIDNYEGK